MYFIYLITIILAYLEKDVKRFKQKRVQKILHSLGLFGIFARYSSICFPKYIAAA